MVFSLDIDECSVGSPCDGNAICTNNEGSFTCVCNRGFSGNGITCSGMPFWSYLPSFVFSPLISCAVWNACKN